MKEMIEPELLTVLEDTQVGKWKVYEDYKASGAEWQGKIPIHWIMRRIKYLAPLATKRLFEKPDNLPYIGLEHIEPETGKFIQDTPVENVESTINHFKKGDILFGKLRPYLAKVLFTDFEGVCTTELLVFQTRNEIYGKYLYYRLISKDFIRFVTSLTYGTKMPRTSSEQISNIPIQVPPLSEQHIIASFLDRETVKINKLIDHKERLISLLQERRMAVINQTVTRGLNPDVPVKDSGVEWLGKIPAHWEIAHLRRVVKNFVDYRGMTPEKVPSGIPLITARNIKNGTIDFSLSQEFIREEDYPSRMIRGFPTKGDVLVTTEAPLGETAQIIDEYIALAQRIILLKLFSFRMENAYLKYYFLSQAGQGELWSRATGSTAIGIKASHLKEILIIVPPLEEQRAIIAYLDKVIIAFDKPISVIQEGIKKLQEYSAALISAAVTGKIDVRGEAADVQSEETAI